jgi:hypothetical protein
MLFGFKQAYVVVKQWVSLCKSHGAVATLHEFLRFIDRHTQRGNIPGSMDFKRFADKKVFNKSVINHKNYSNVHPNQFRAQGKKIYFLSDTNIKPKALGEFTSLISVKALTDEEIKGGVFYVYFTCDSDAYSEIMLIVKNGGKFIGHLDSAKTSYRFIERSAFNALRKTWSRSRQANLAIHENICEALNITKHLKGDYLEIGVYLGGTMLTACNFVDELFRLYSIQKRVCYGIDTFEGFNYEQAAISGDVIWEGGHKLLGKAATMNYVENLLADSGTYFELFCRNICDQEVPDKIDFISVANIDVDLYEATLSALHAVHPRLVIGGIIICEDPASTPALYGSYLAMEQFLASTEGSFYTKIFKGGSYFLIKNSLIADSINQ